MEKLNELKTLIAKNFEILDLYEREDIIASIFYKNQFDSNLIKCLMSVYTQIKNVEFIVGKLAEIY